MTARLLHLDPDDDVGVALEPIRPGDPLGPGPARDDVPRGHKIALTELAGRRTGAQVRPRHRHGQPADPDR